MFGSLRQQTPISGGRSPINVFVKTSTNGCGFMACPYHLCDHGPATSKCSQGTSFGTTREQWDTIFQRWNRKRGKNWKTTTIQETSESFQIFWNAQFRKPMAGR